MQINYYSKIVFRWCIYVAPRCEKSSIVTNCYIFFINNFLVIGFENTIPAFIMIIVSGVDHSLISSHLTKVYYRGNLLYLCCIAYMYHVAGVCSRCYVKLEPTAPVHRDDLMSTSPLCCYLYSVGGSTLVWAPYQSEIRLFQIYLTNLCKFIANINSFIGLFRLENIMWFCLRFNWR